MSKIGLSADVLCRAKIDASDAKRNIGRRGLDVPVFCQYDTDVLEQAGRL